jgi:flagellar basal-body rod protein FlgB
MSSLFQTRTTVVVKGALDGLAARHRVFLHNIANVETPGFQPSDVPFEVELRKVRDDLAQHPSAQGDTPRPKMAAVLEDQDASRVDGNGVQADYQMVRLAENTLTYEALTQAARLRGELLRSVITEGKR